MKLRSSLESKLKKNPGEALLWTDLKILKKESKVIFVG